jgi:PAS domain S-box-containing protein
MSPTSEQDQRSAELAAIVESSEDAIISKNLDGRIRTWNAAAERIYGYTAAEAIGEPMTMLLSPERQKEEMEILERLRRGEQVSHFETTRLRKGGEIIHVSLTISPLRGSDGRILGASHVARDVTERKQFEQQLRQSQRLESLGVLAGGIAHDFNNLLTGILANASLAAEVLNASNAAQPFLRDVVTATQRLSDLTRQLLAYAGRGAPALTPVNLSVLVAEISALIQASIPKHVQVRLALDQQIPEIMGDASQLQQIVMNLILNGAEAISTNSLGSVLVSTGYQEIDEAYIKTALISDPVEPGGFVCLEVHDTGSGMDSETQARIFDPFFTTKVHGRGLGLAAVLGIVRSHNGVIKVYSQSGKGTTFKVLLPAQAKGESQSARSHPEALRGSGTVLVVDDEEIIRSSARNVLELFGYRVIMAEDGQQAVRIYEQRAGEIDIVLLDLLMPHMGGETAYGRLRLVRPDVRVVLTSGHSDTEAQARFTGKALAGFIKKPYTAVELALEIKRALANGTK